MQPPTTSSLPSAPTPGSSPHDTSTPTVDGTTMREVAVRISQYFRDFLESDFKRAQAPRRRIILTSESGFRSGMRLTPYAALDRDVWTLLGKASGEELKLSIAPRKYTRPISPTLRKVIAEQVDAIPEPAVHAIRVAVQDKALATLPKAIDNPEAWIEQVQDVLAREASAQVIRPLLAHLAGPLKEQAYWVMDSLYSAEGDLVARVADDLARVLPDVLARLLATQNPEPLRDACEHQLTLEGVRLALMGFFENFVAADAYHEFRDLETYVSTSEGLQLYLYIGVLKFAGNQYPLFYLPIEVERSPDSSGYTLRLVNQLFANKRAVDYVLQEVANGLGRAWASPLRERINYLTPEQSIFELAHLLFRQVANAVDLGGRIELSSSAPEASTSNVGLSSALHFAAFERSDEALLNDFEEIIDQAKRGGSALVDLFEGMVNGVLMKNPVPIGPNVESVWEGLPLVDRLVTDTVVPLNEEQRKVLLAVDQPQGKIIVVEGPPGTGKSHTITAIAADCALKKRSCLVLSDKPEALDVVYDKLSEAMSRVRHDRDFPNPILRLGQQATNFKRLISNQTVTQVGHYARAMRANQPKLDAERQDTAEHLKRAIAVTVETLGSVSLAQVQAMHQQEDELSKRAPDVLAALHAVEDASALSELTPLLTELDALEQYLKGLFDAADYDTPRLLARARRDMCLTTFAQNRSFEGWSWFEALDGAQLRALGTILLQFEQLRMPVFGYLFRGGAIRALELELNRLPVTRPILLKRDAAALAKVNLAANELRLKLEQEGVADAFPDGFRQLAHGTPPPTTAGTTQRVIALMHRLNPAIVDALLAHPKDDPGLWPLAIRFLHTWMATRSAFMKAPQFDYVGEKTKLERLNTSAMNTHVDSRLVEFMDHHRSDARALAGVISSRQKFPVDKFDAVKSSFPVIIAGIREFGQYMPLVPDLIDVLVIDEGSQVSVAQALPALLRAKKVVVLGDSKQFSNVKAANASIALNEKYRADLVNYFRSNVSHEAHTLERLAMFDVKKSVLEFASLAASYTVMLRKHFRSYQELIGYSSNTFYANQLQALKIRSVPLDEVIRFSEVELDGKRATRNTNEAEADFILEQLLELLEEEHPPTVGIITPFREQQTLLSKRLFGHLRGRDFEDKLRLMVRTFDSCQGDERQIIFYSMVASAGNDALNYIFPVALDNAAESVEDKLKVQRLNVGFSRAQEMIWIVHSQPLEAFRGAIGQALAFYANTLTRKDVTADQVDPNSPMEVQVLDWLKKTPFVQQHGDAIEILPQFPVGDYLRQLDPTYRHPAWRVDFLVTVQTNKGAVQIVIEYDGFQHFMKGKQVHVGNHERYLVEADVERQLTLESYGYRFLRINRFNLGKDPVQTLSDRLSRLLELAGAEPEASAVDDAIEQAVGLANKERKVCSRCGEIREQAQFHDPQLRDGAGGYGRVCMPCKDKDPARRAGPAPKAKRGRRRGRWR